jgi:hypothetical protein
MTRPTRDNDRVIGHQPADAPPDPEHYPATLFYRDAVITRPVGYRPLMADLAVPEAVRPVPLVVYIYGGAFATGSHKRSPLRQYLIDRLIPGGIAVASILGLDPTRFAT